VDDDFGIAIRQKPMPIPLKTSSLPLEIVDLAIADQNDLLVGTQERLRAMNEVDDRQARVRETQASIRVEINARAIRPPMAQGGSALL
jgi:hypothetical protein